MVLCDYFIYLLLVLVVAEKFGDGSAAVTAVAPFPVLLVLRGFCGGAATLAFDAAKSLEQAGRYSEEFASLLSDVREAAYTLSACGDELRNKLKLYSDDFDPAQIDRIEERLDLLYGSISCTACSASTAGAKRKCSNFCRMPWTNAKKSKCPTRFWNACKKRQTKPMRRHMPLPNA